MDNPNCARCGAEIEPGQGQLVGAGDGRLWLICALCALSPVHINDLRPDAEPVMGG